MHGSFHLEVVHASIMRQEVGRKMSRMAIAKSDLACLKTVIATNGQPVGWYFINTNRFLREISHIVLWAPQEFIKYSKAALWMVQLKMPPNEVSRK